MYWDKSQDFSKAFGVRFRATAQSSQSRDAGGFKAPLLSPDLGLLGGMREDLGVTYTSSLGFPIASGTVWISTALHAAAHPAAPLGSQLTWCEAITLGVLSTLLCIEFQRTNSQMG